ncbi:MAG: D-alanyl-D-alanine carboxypeptidase family protein [Erysipelotrichaceae bacterium]|nr:D-alanyl-D-alanine carboxypeptidase family protein [Erysipelotrichaceae bacterium]
MTANKDSKTKKKKPKRRVRWWLLAIIGLVIAGIVYLATMPYRNDNRKLEQLGYDKEAIALIREKELLQVILDNEYYSKYLAAAIKDGSLRKDYIALYAVIPDRRPDSVDFLLYRRLEDAGYEEDQLLNLFAALKQEEMTPLLVYDYQWDEQGYISDVVNNRDSGHFDISGDYRQMFKITEKAPDPDSFQVLVSRHYYLDERYAPKDLKDISDQFSVGGTVLREEAGLFATKMIEAAQSGGAYFYISDSYWNYTDLDEMNGRYLSYLSEDDFDAMYARAGFNEHQTGLALNMAATYEDEEDFRKTDAYRWLKDNAASFGFIERFPENKEMITGRQAEPDHWRYVGRATAMALKNSKLTFDEFYCLYLKDWEDPELVPSESILNQIDWYMMTD